MKKYNRFTKKTQKKQKERNSGIIQKKAIKPQKKRKGTNVNYLNAPIKR